MTGPHIIRLAHGFAAVVIPRCPITRKACTALDDNRACCRDTGLADTLLAAHGPASTTPTKEITE